MLLQIIRGIFLMCLVAIALSYVMNSPAEDTKAINEGYKLFVFHKQSVLLGLVGIGILIIGLDLLISRKSLSAISGLFMGLLAGMLLAFIFSLVMDMVIGVIASDLREPIYSTIMRDVNGKALPQTVVTSYRDTPAVSAAKLVVGIICCYLSVSFILQTKDDIRFVIPYVEFEKQIKGGRPLILDTSAIIDGRILDVAKTKIFDNPLVVPRFVLQELQAVADSTDRLKRNRGRRGLDIINKLQTEKGLDISIYEKPGHDIRQPVDQKLVTLAEDIKGKIVTTDFNLNKVAHIRGVEVVNINDLTNALKPVVLPGETLEVKIIKAGVEQGQGVAYLEDGTMVVVEGARKRIGEMLIVNITSSLQTSAGRMIFARVDDGTDPRINGHQA
ncbi:MAG: TRAM domain-containing protein [Phycisphaerae bacterium]